MSAASLAPMDATAIVHGLNDEAAIERTVDRIAGHVQRVVVAEPYANAAGIDTAWEIHLGAGEHMTDDAIAGLRRAMADAAPDTDAMMIRRTVRVLGRNLRFGGYRRHFETRVRRRGRPASAGPGGTVRLEDGMIVDDGFRSVHGWIGARNRLTTLRMADRMLQEHGRNVPQARFRSADGPRGIARFFYRYLILLGFLDGKRGLLFHFFDGVWSPFLTRVKTFEARRAIARGNDVVRWIGETYDIDLPADPE